MALHFIACMFDALQCQVWSVESVECRECRECLHVKLSAKKGQGNKNIRNMEEHGGTKEQMIQNETWLTDTTDMTDMAATGARKDRLWSTHQLCRRPGLRRVRTGSWSSWSLPHNDLQPEKTWKEPLWIPLSEINDINNLQLHYVALCCTRNMSRLHWMCIAMCILWRVWYRLAIVQAVQAVQAAQAAQAVQAGIFSNFSGTSMIWNSENVFKLLQTEQEDCSVNKKPSRHNSRHKQYKQCEQYEQWMNDMNEMNERDRPKSMTLDMTDMNR